MAFTGFSASDFKVFDLHGFQPRMAAIRGQIRPKLEALGELLVPAVARATGEELTRTRDGQLVVGRRVSQADAVTWGPTEYTKAAGATFEALIPLYRLR